uniref:Phosphotransferase n=1 Tax=Plectus sambesii TaxID=2011161 RepID=A0A914WFP3_9BILA
MTKWMSLLPLCCLGPAAGFNFVVRFFPELVNVRVGRIILIPFDFPSGELDCILTSFDREIDAASVHKGKQIVDKVTGALYLGELVRRILAQLVIDGLLFGAQPCERLDQPDSFPAKYISEILRDDESTSFKNSRRICDELEVPNHGSSDYVIIREICHVVSQRSASIVAAAITALLKHMGRDRVKIGVGGALIQFHPTYHQLLEEKLSALAPDGVE